MSDKTSRNNSWAVWLCYAAMAAIAITVNLVPVYLTTISADFGTLTQEQLGRIGAVTFAGVVLGVLVGGPLADRWGAKVFALGGNVLVAIGLGLLAFSPNYTALLLALFLEGFGAGMLDMVLSPIVCAICPDRRTAAMNWLHSFYCVGAVGTVVVSSAALQMGISWRTLALVLLPLVAAIAVGFAFIKIPPLVKDGHDRMPLRQLTRIPYFWVVMAAIFFGGATELGMSQWLPAYAETTLGYSKWTGGMSLLIFSLMMTFGRMGAGMLAGRIHPISLLIGCCGFSIVFFLLGSFAPWNVVALLACMLAGLAGSCLWPTTLGIAGDRFPHGGATLFGLMAAMGNFGGIFMPWVVGAIADVSNLRWGLATAALCPVFMLVALFWMRRHDAKTAR